MRNRVPRSFNSGRADQRPRWPAMDAPPKPSLRSRTYRSLAMVLGVFFIPMGIWLAYLQSSADADWRRIARALGMVALGVTFVMYGLTGRSRH